MLRIGSHEYRSRLAICLALFLVAHCTGCQTPIADAIDAWKYRDYKNKFDNQYVDSNSEQVADGQANNRVAGTNRNLTRALDAEGRGDIAEAFNYYSAVLHQDPNHVVANHRVGVLYDMQHDYGSAERHYLHALRFSPNDPNLLSDLGFSYIEQRRYPDAERYLGQALRTNPNHTKAMHNYALLYARQGDAKAATAMLQRAGNSPAEINQMLAQLFPRNATPPNETSPSSVLPSEDTAIAARERASSTIAHSSDVVTTENTELPSINPEPGASSVLPPGIATAPRFPDAADNATDEVVASAIENAEEIGNFADRYEELAPSPLVNNSLVNGLTDSGEGTSNAEFLARNDTAPPNNGRWQDMPTSRTDTGELGTASFEVSNQDNAFPGSDTIAGSSNNLNRLNSNGGFESNQARGGGLSPNPLGTREASAGSSSNFSPADVAVSAKTAAFLGMEAGGGMFAMNSTPGEIRQEPPPKFPGPGVSYNSQNFPVSNERARSKPASNNFNTRSEPQQDFSNTAPRNQFNSSPPNSNPATSGSETNSNANFIPSSSFNNLSPRGNLPSSFQSNGTTSNAEGLEEIRVRMAEQRAELESLQRRLLDQRRKVSTEAGGEGSTPNSQPGPFPGNTSFDSSTSSNGGSASSANFENRFARPGIPSAQRRY